MTKTDLSRRLTARRLRRKVHRYRTLAITNGNAEDVNIIEALSREHDEEASRIEREIVEGTSLGT